MSSYDDSRKADKILTELGLTFVDCGLYFDTVLDFYEQDKSYGYELSWPKNGNGFYLKICDPLCARFTQQIYFDGSELSLTLFKSFVQTLMQINRNFEPLTKVENLNIPI